MVRTPATLEKINNLFFCSKFGSSGKSSILKSINMFSILNGTAEVSLASSSLYKSSRLESWVVCVCALLADLMSQQLTAGLRIQYLS